MPTTLCTLSSKVSLPHSEQLIHSLLDAPVLTAVLDEATEYLLQGDFMQAANHLQNLMGAVVDKALANCMTRVFENQQFRQQLRIAAAHKDLVFKENLDIRVQMPNGNHHSVISPWFQNADKTGRRKVGPKTADSSRKGAHFGLDIMGFFGKVCPTLAFRGIVYGILCPSLAIASALLADNNITLSQNKLRHIFQAFDSLDYPTRAQLGTPSGQTLENQRVVIADDGARFRERVPKKGRIPNKNKRRPFDTPWREPKIFTIFTIDEEGRIQKDFPIQADGTVGDTDCALQNALELLRAYLQHLDIAKAKSVTLIGDGAKWIWKRIPMLLEELGVHNDKITEIIDYYHAKQNLNQMLDSVHYDVFNPRETLESELSDLLYQGDIEQIGKRLNERAASGNKRKLKKNFEEYFNSNAKRFCYADFRDKHHPIGSGCVESAVRRIINLRIKSPSIFWSEAKAETMIFLRGKLLYGRWPTLVQNWLTRCRGLFQYPNLEAPA